MEEQELSEREREIFADLSFQEVKFIVAYSQHGNGGLAAQEAGYAVDNKNSAYSQATRMLRNVKITKAMAAFGELHAMSKGEALQRMRNFSRGSIEPFLDSNGAIIQNKEQIKDFLHLVKKVKRKVTTRTIKVDDEYETIETVETELELYDAMSATDKILNVHGAYKTPTDAGDGARKIQAYEMPNGVLIYFNA